LKHWQTNLSDVTVENDSKPAAEEIEILLLPKDDDHERVKNEQIPWFVPLDSAAGLLAAAFSTFKFTGKLYRYDD
jgi:hypothetical protein